MPENSPTNTDLLIDALHGEMQLYQAAIQVILSKLVQRHDGDPIAMCSGLQRDVLAILQHLDVGGSHATRAQRARAHAISRVPGLFHLPELKAKILAGATSANSSKNN